MKSTSDFIKMKSEDEKISMVTAYDYPSAKLSEKADIDMLLVGDSLGMVVLGYDSTVAVTLEDMIHHTKAVRRGAPDTFVVTDMPFMTYHLSKRDTLQAAMEIVQKSGAHAVKVEGGGAVIDTIADLTTAGIPVVAHLGLTPQSVGVLGGYKVQGKTAEAAEKLIEEAKRCEEAGAFALVVECIPRQLAAEVTKSIKIPVIGIGAGSETDGQVLVFHDIMTYGVERIPKFVKKYADFNEAAAVGLRTYHNEVKDGRFPEVGHTFTMKEEELQSLYGGKN
ncbi:3-methyl-2-oxobutanoate hydroxymethyltransferase [Rossellomorea vietnamensis]|uniref:3-methyl-2-oxobutanoate hydroxymethyltransferase n=1 Tax=Rossellomorea vietnamensis TaxID=218284 RepID=A0A5D4MGF1_9BACI|nr:3-methyl-2-oxobutanoate hydroxymethyltransferase [Rossellomorea vietnamensis]TYS00519.1 3-methyl-2-oxobutanoate hydroxymethyltransferase [Rossellomorea vietnamensis]